MNNLTAAEIYKIYQEKLKDETKKKGEVFLTCGSCNQKSFLKNYYQVITYWYVDCPYTPNYNWSDALSLICPKCNVLNRLLNKTSKSYEKVRNYTGRYNSGEYAKSYDYYSRWGDDHFTLTGKSERIPTPYTNHVNV